MQGPTKAASVAKGRVSGNGAPSKRASKKSVAATTVVFAHRTPTQLHASTYAPERG